MNMVRYTWCVSVCHSEVNSTLKKTTVELTTINRNNSSRKNIVLVDDFFFKVEQDLCIHRSGVRGVTLHQEKKASQADFSVHE